MGYVLLTGSTGLVGRYLLRDLLSFDERVAVIVRVGRGESALTRVDRVMSYWEQCCGHALPRPVVFEADLNDLDSSLIDVDRRWITENCDSVLHCAASMTFRKDKLGEPFRTNVEGTSNLLRLCQQAGIRRFHHVSTAYVCGLRQGRVLETELDEGQVLGNVYEESKLQAEKSVRQADFLDQVTVYRPASVVGDFRTGYVTSFHGFYLPLQLAHVMASRVPVAAMNERFLGSLRLQGHEGKNLVPVNWLARAISTLFRDAASHGTTYHLASAKPVSAQLIQRVIQHAIERYHPNPLREARSETDLSAIESLFKEHMSVYRSHWRDDPAFDLTNTRRGLPNLQCPEMDYEALMRIARYPIEQNFVASRYEPHQVEFDAQQHLSRWQESSATKHEPCDRIGLHLSGSGGGQWEVCLRNNRVVGVERGAEGANSGHVYLTTQTYQALMRHELSIDESLQCGRVFWEGNGSELRGALAQLV